MTWSAYFIAIGKNDYFSERCISVETAYFLLISNKKVIFYLDFTRYTFITTILSHDILTIFRTGVSFVCVNALKEKLLFQF